MEPGDSVFMPKRPFYVAVSGEVLNPTSLQFKPGAHLSDYINEAGGFTQTAEDDRVFVVLPNGQAQPVKNSFWNFTPVEVPPGSTIVVPKNLTAVRSHQLPQGFDPDPQPTRDLRGIARGVAAAIRRASSPDRAELTLSRACRASFPHRLAAALGAALAAGGARAQVNLEPPPFVPSYDDWGEYGLIQTPTARTGQDGDFGFTFSHVHPYDRYNIFVTPLPWFQGGFRYTAINNRPYAPGNNQSFKDKSIDLKLRLAPESASFPETSIGFRDIAGTGSVLGRISRLQPPLLRFRFLGRPRLGLSRRRRHIRQSARCDLALVQGAPGKRPTAPAPSRSIISAAPRSDSSAASSITRPTVA